MRDTFVSGEDVVDIQRGAAIFLRQVVSVLFRWPLGSDCFKHFFFVHGLLRMTFGGGVEATWLFPQRVGLLFVAAESLSVLAGVVGAHPRLCVVRLPSHGARTSSRVA